MKRQGQMAGFIRGDLVGREAAGSSRSLHRASERPDPRTLIPCQGRACHEPPGAVQWTSREEHSYGRLREHLMVASDFGIAAPEIIDIDGWTTVKTLMA